MGSSQDSYSQSPHTDHINQYCLPLLFYTRIRYPDYPQGSIWNLLSLVSDGWGGLFQHALSSGFGFSASCGSTRLNSALSDEIDSACRVGVIRRAEHVRGNWDRSEACKREACNASVDQTISSFQLSSPVSQMINWSWIIKE